MSLWTPLGCFVATMHLLSQSLSIVTDVMLLHCVCCTKLIRTRIIFLFSELPSASVRVRYTQAAAAALEFEASWCRTSPFARCFLPAQTRVWNDLHYTVFDTGTLEGFKGAVKRWLLLRVCFSVFRGAGACRVA